MCLYQTIAENQTEVLKVSYVLVRNAKFGGGGGGGGVCEEVE